MAYLAQADDMPVVVRWRKPDTRFSPEEAQRRARSEYEAAHHFFTFVNSCCPGASPDFHAYHMSDTAAFAVERYIGQPLTSLLPTFTQEDCFAFGAQAGTFFAQLHQQSAPVSGYGHVWLKDGILQGRKVFAPAIILQDRRRGVQEAWQALVASELAFDRKVVESNVSRLMEELVAPERLCLTSTDLTPEHLMRQPSGVFGLIDPVPVLGTEAYYVAFFLYTYRLLIPSAANSPRFRHHHLERYEASLQAVADGYLHAYLKNAPQLDLRQVELELYHWILRDAYHILRNLGNTDEMFLRLAGNAAQRGRGLERYLGKLEIALAG